VMLSKKAMNSKDVKLSEVGKELFNMFDKDGGGEISLDEMTATFKQTGKNWDMEGVCVCVCVCACVCVCVCVCERARARV